MRVTTAALLSLALLAAACGGGEPETTSPSTTQTAAPAGSDIADLVRSDVPPGRVPVPGREGPATLDMLAEDAELRDLATEAGLVEAYLVLFALPEDPLAWTLGGAMRFSSDTASEQFIDQVKDRAAELFALGLGQAGAELLGLSTSGDTTGILAQSSSGSDNLLGSCMTIEKLEQEDDVVVFWVDLTGCKARDSVTEAALVCPAVLQAGGSGSTTLVTPTYAEPLAWIADPDTIKWTIDGPVDATVVNAGKVVLGELTVTNAQSDEQTVTVQVQFERISRVEWGGPDVILNAGLVVGSCTINVVDEAAPASVAGAWTFDITTAPVNDYCDESENYQANLVFEQTDSAVKVTGIPGQIGTWEGSLTGNQVTFGGEKEDGAGRTMATFVMTVDEDTMTGQELWSYEDSGGSCPDGTSVVTATRTG